jgi:hypothetical protein
LHFFTINIVFYNPPPRIISPEESNLKDEVARLTGDNFPTYMLHHPISPVVFVPFWTGGFLMIGGKSVDPFSGPLVLLISLLRLFSPGGV